MEHPFFHAGINATYYNRVCPVPSTALMLRHMLYWGCGPTDYRTGVDVMASFTNFATLIYNGGTSNSNTVTGELLETLTLTKTAASSRYTARDNVTYVLSLVNGGTTPLTELALTDNLGGYAFGTDTVYPLTYNEGTLRVYVNGVLQTTPTVTAGPPLTVTGLTVPAGGNALLVYEAAVTRYAPLDQEAAITNTATVTGGGLAAPLTAQATLAAAQRADLTVSKAICPATVTESGQLTYTFVLQNFGNTAATAGDNVILTDTFDPALTGLTVTYNGDAWKEGDNYTYDAATGTFATIAGQITVPAATYTQETDGTYTVTPGTTTVTVTGTV